MISSLHNPCRVREWKKWKSVNTCWSNGQLSTGLFFFMKHGVCTYWDSIVTEAGEADLDVHTPYTWPHQHSNHFSSTVHRHPPTPGTDSLWRHWTWRHRAWSARPPPAAAPHTSPLTSYKYTCTVHVYFSSRDWTK